MSIWVDQRGDEYRLREINRPHSCKWEGPNGEVVTTPYIWPQPHAQANGRKYINAWPMKYLREENDQKR